MLQAKLLSTTTTQKEQEHETINLLWTGKPTTAIINSAYIGSQWVGKTESRNKKETAWMIINWSSGTNSNGKFWISPPPTHTKETQNMIQKLLPQTEEITLESSPGPTCGTSPVKPQEQLKIIQESSREYWNHIENLITELYKIHWEDLNDEDVTSWQDYELSKTQDAGVTDSAM